MIRLLPEARALALGLSIIAASSGCGNEPVHLRMATTTSVDNSGLLASILPAFEHDARIDVDVIAVGSGQAINLVRRGDAAIGLTHDPAAENGALSSGAIAGYTKIMFNDFVIAGPPGDPAGAAHASSAPDAFARIARSGAAFASRGDASGTYSREQALWTQAKRRPAAGLVLETGQGMAGTLRVASERAAYTLTDRATYEQLRPSLRLDIQFQGGGDLLNTYAVFVRAGLEGKDRASAETLARWLSDGEGRGRIAAFTAGGQHVFTLWPADAPRHRPSDRPAVELTHAR